MKKTTLVTISLVVFMLMIISSLNLASALTIDSVDTTPYQIKPGEDIRAGRWWWEQEGNKECGLHIDP